MWRNIYILSLLLSSCTDEFESPPISQSDMWDCHHESIWNEIYTRDSLIGVWEWEFVGCYYTELYTAYVTEMGVTIEFKPDSSLIVKQQDSIVQISSWQVVDGDGDLYEIEVDPFVDQLWGRILFCDNRVEFNKSYADICDNYFIKRE